MKNQENHSVKRAGTAVKTDTKKIVTMGLLAALSIVLVFFFRFSIFPPAPFLEYDPADVPILIGTIMYGPVAGLILTVVVSIIQGTTVSAGSGLYGILMHIVATGAMTLVVGSLYKYSGKKLHNLVIALGAGVLTMAVVMAGANVIITPLFMGVPREQVIQMIMPIFVPFNLIKAGINAVMAFVLLKSFEKARIFQKS